jgi:hypothetical protein
MKYLFGLTENSVFSLDRTVQSGMYSIEFPTVRLLAVWRLFVSSAISFPNGAEPCAGAARFCAR